MQNSMPSETTGIFFFKFFFLAKMYLGEFEIFLQVKFCGLFYMHTYTYACIHVYVHAYSHVLLNYQWGYVLRNASLGGLVAMRTAESALTQTSKVRPSTHLVCVGQPVAPRPQTCTAHYYSRRDWMKPRRK